MKYKYLIIMVGLLIQTLSSLYAQKEYSNWYFGKYAGITFNTQSGEPEFLEHNKINQYEGNASLSDKDGNLILYSNGVDVYNGQGDKINKDNETLMGHQSSTQSAIITKMPSSSNLYYIFTSDAGDYADPPNQGIHYSIIDMNGLGGRGEIISLNVPLLGVASEKLTSTNHGNGKDVWILSKGYGNNNLYAWLLTDKGLVDTVITSLGYTPKSQNESIGYMKVSSKGNKVALVYTEKPFIELVNFDNKTGVFSNLLTIPVDGYYSLYGLEFSPNRNYLYVSNSGSLLDFYTIFQFDIRSQDVNKIANSRVVVDKNNGTIGAIQIAPDNLIYIAASNKNYLMGIMNPDRRCPQCRFNNNVISLEDSLSYMGLPQSIPIYNTSKNILACETLTAQLDPDDILEDTSRYAFSYEWSGPNGYLSNSPRPEFNNVSMSDTGAYTLIVKYVIGKDTVSMSFVNYLLVNPKNSFSIIGGTTLCEGDTLSLQADTMNLNFSYLWSTGSRRSTLKVTKPGEYKLYITSRYGCVDSAEININMIPKPIAKIDGPKLLCNNSSITLTSKYQSDTLKYLWSTGETTPSINVKQVGTYTLKVSNDYGCSNIDEINVVRHDELKIDIAGDSVICNPNPAKLFAVILPYDSTLKYEYHWSDGQADSSVLINKPGIVKLTVTIEGNCEYTSEITVEKTDPPKVELNLKDTVEFCNGDYIELKVIEPDSKLQYTWSNGEKGDKIVPKKSGQYTVYASNYLGCTSEKSVYIIISEPIIAYIESDYFTNNCTTDSVALSVYPKDESFTYQWSNGLVGDSIIVLKSGNYFVTIKDKFACMTNVSIEVVIGSGIKANIIGDTRACLGDTITLRATLNDNTIKSYKWSNGETSEYIRVNTSDTYSVEITDETGCKAAASINILFIERLDAELNIKDTVQLCDGDSIVISPIKYDDSYQYSWEDGQEGASRTIKQSGLYRLYVTNNNLCTDSSQVYIIFHKLEYLAIKSDREPIICNGGELELYVDSLPNITYHWFNGSSRSRVLVNQAGNYYLIYENEFACKDSINFVVKSGTVGEFSIIADKQEFCKGDSVILSTNKPYSRYQWSNGASSSTIVVKRGAWYSLIVSDENGCSSKDSIFIKEHGNLLNIDIISDSSFVSCEYIYVDSVQVLNSDTLEYQINDILSSKNLEILNKEELITKFASGEQAYIKFQIKEPKLGINKYNFSIVSNNPCPISKQFSVTYSLKAETLIYLDTLRLESGSVACLPVHYKKLCPNDYIINSGFIFTIDIPAEYFNPESLTIGTIISKKLIGENWRLIIRVDNFKESADETLLLKICGTNLIGSDIKATIQIKDFKWDSDDIIVEKKDGVISSIACAINIRAIKYFKPTNLTITPNPATENINVTITTSSIGRHYLKVYNSKSELISETTFEYRENSPYIKKLVLNSHNLENGIYFVVLQSPWGVINTEKIIVIK
ncbi:MAG TPA: hypothetical protein PLE30_02775 [Candidatus Kapabacteria bacterium]|nr:hypothetical protein [Candidatus Kapabacteria bacterium]